jgi:hypothetical protein
MQYLQWEQLRAPGGDEVGWLAFAGILVSMIGGIVLQGALTRASLDDLGGKGAGLSGALAAGFGLILPLIGLGILMTLGQALGLLLLIVPGIYLMLRWAVAAPVLVTEGIGVTAAMARSADLTENHRWAILGLGLLFMLLVYGAMILVAYIVPQFTGSMDLMQGAQIAGYVQTGATVFTSIIGAVGAASIYFELRQIKEGVGVTELANVFD